MRQLIQITAIAATMCLLAAFIAAQTTAQIERDLLAKIKKIDKASAYTSAKHNDVLLAKVNADFKASLLKYTKLASTLRYGFPQLAKEIDIVTSADKKFRVYTWDRQDGGTMHFYETVYQYLGEKGKVFSRGTLIPKNEDREGPDPQAFAINIFSLDTKSGTVYMLLSSSTLSTSEATQQIDLFRIKGNLLDNRVKLIKTKRGLTNTLGFEFDFFSVVDRPERPLRLISYNAATKTIKLPIVIVDKKFQYGRVTPRSITYKFNGTYFVKVG